MRIGAGTVTGLYFGTTAVSAAYLGATQVFGGGPSFDADALAYITAVEAADAQALEAGVKTAINDFVVGCKADGIWAAIKASCILAGARTLNGALVPIKGAAPTNFNFVTGDYNRKTGLVGDGATKYLDSNRANSADPQDSRHLAVFVSAASLGGDRVYIGAADGNGGGMIVLGSTFVATGLASGTNFTTIPGSSVGLIAASRDTSANYTARGNSASETVTRASNVPTSVILRVFRGHQYNFSNGRLSFYSIGESLDLAALDTRVSALMTAIDGAI
jgi:hypothetical protein